MKKLLAIIFSLAILAGCAAEKGTEVRSTSRTSSTAESAERTVTTAETATDSETTSVTGEKLPINAEFGVNSDGTLNNAFTEKINSLFDHTVGNSSLGIGVFPSLWDFNDDGVPEIILTYHTGEEGYMPCKVYDSESFKQIGEFDGFCRDGFTRFVNGYDGGTVIYNYYEDSYRQRDETVEFVHIENGRLARKKKIYHHWWIFGQVMQLEYESFARANSMEEDFLDYNFGTVCTSYGVDVDSSERAAAAVESYNNYIKLYKVTEEDYPVGCVFIGQKNEAAVYEINGEGFFKDENGEVTPLNNDLPYFNIYKLWDDIIVCQPLGNTQPCDVYIMTDGNPVLDEKLSGHGMLFDHSHIYNGGFEMTESVYDASTVGSHTFKKYQFYRDESGFHEYGSIVVPVEEFNKYYSESVPIYLNDTLAAMKGWGVDADDLEIYEVLYRSDNCFILNCRNPIIVEDTNDDNGYNFFNITLKTSEDGKFTEAYRDWGVYKTALIPEIAVYPEKMYIPEK